MSVGQTLAWEGVQTAPDFSAEGGGSVYTREDVTDQPKAPFGDWMVAQRNRRRPMRPPRGVDAVAGTPAGVTGNGYDHRQQPRVAKPVRHAIGGSATGSHFSILVEPDETPAVEVPVHNSLSGGPRSSQHVKEVGRAMSGKGKEPVTLAKEGNGPVGPRVVTSHAHLTENLIHVDNVGSSVGGPSTHEDRIMEDISNRVEKQPMKVQQTRSGPRGGIPVQSKEPDLKGIKRINEAWAETEVIELMEA